MSEPAAELPADAPDDGKQEGGVTGKGFTKGRSGNPGGRPKGLAKVVREMPNELGAGTGEEVLARFWWDVVSNPREDMKDRLLASRLLAERGWGKAPQYAPIEDDDPLDLSVRRQNEIAADLESRIDELTAARLRREAREAGEPEPEGEAAAE